MIIPGLSQLLGLRFLGRMAQGFASRSFAGGIYHQLTGSAVPQLGAGAGKDEQAGYALGRVAAHASNAAVALSRVNIVNTEYYNSLAKYSATISKATGRLAQAQVFKDSYYAQTLGASYARNAESVIGRDLMARTAITDFERLKLGVETWVNKAAGGLGFAYGAWKRVFAEGIGLGTAVDREKDALAKAKAAQNVAAEWIFDLGKHYNDMGAEAYKPRGPAGQRI